MFVYFDFYFVEDTGAVILDFFIVSFSLSFVSTICPWYLREIGSRTHHRCQNMKMLKSFKQPSVSASSATWNPTKHESQS